MDGAYVLNIREGWWDFLRSGEFCVQQLMQMVLWKAIILHEAMLCLRNLQGMKDKKLNLMCGDLSFFFKDGIINLKFDIKNSRETRDIF